MIKTISSSLLLLCCLQTTMVQAETYPKVTLDNDVMQVDMFLPDAEKGYYRGPRFDWSGIIEKVTYKGHTFYGPLHEEHDPTGHDFVSGPAEEFGMYNPMGYKDAKVGETFLKVGVGLLQKTSNEDYQFYGNYPIVQAGSWKIESTERSIEFTQALQTDNGWGYQYSKNVELLPGKSQMRIAHQLTNTGKNTIELDNYSHNFTIIDDVPYGPDYSVEFPFTSPTDALINERAWYKGNKITLDKPLLDNALWHVVHKDGGDSSLNGATVKNHKTGASLSFEGDSDITHFIFWAVERAACPEPFIAINLAPGQQKTWQTTYTFSAQ